MTTEETNMLKIHERNVVREIQNNENAGEYEQTRWGGGDILQGKNIVKFIKSL